ncbi:hypothetical protein DOTSEDRAFT_29497 [Dothistroma septosporum NZE10]|uniref:Uncharacterized protein n=1 Tax=Dothistroma septosporum (strain NZE10 / CBS 128990) TaxID=675120 RepID=N1PDC7_DOTSN|nr:hypothetical protein DOTSEDRAFT_29497 [Dothistroma septosporum NZE10]
MTFNIEDCYILVALQEDPESSTETYDEVLSRPEGFWEDFLLQHRGLVHIAFCVPQRNVPNNAWTHNITKDIWMILNGTAHAMAVNTDEFKVHADMFFLSTAVRGRAGGDVKELMKVDRDTWLPDQLNATCTAPPRIARLRGNVKPGRNQAVLLRFYVKSGWFIAGKQTFGANLLAKSGPEGVELARKKGYRMDEMSVVIEKVFTVAHLEWQVEESKRALKASNRKSQL